MVKRLSTVERLDALIREYNFLEDSAFEKFREIFYLLKAGSGHRRLELAGGKYIGANSFNSPDRMDGKLHLDQYDREIENYIVSNPESLFEEVIETNIKK